MASKVEMIYDIVLRTEEKVDKQNARMTKVEIAAEKLKGKMHVMNSEQNRVKSDIAAVRGEFEDHEDDDEVHFNQAIAGETTWQKARRKAPAYGIVATGAGGGLYVLFEAIKWMVNNWQG